MHFVFFDIECSNCFNGIGKICEFGYVVTDEYFNLKYKGDIPMSPGRGKDCRFNLRDKMKKQGIELAYPEDYYFTLDEFPAFYERIKHLLTMPDSIIFGYSIDNDIRYLNGTIQRYHKPVFNYSAYDIQCLAKRYISTSKEAIGLEKAFNSFATFDEKKDIVPHLSRDDAYMTMLVFKHISEELGFPALKIIHEICPEYKINAKDYLDDFVAHKEQREENKRYRSNLNKWFALNPDKESEDDPRISICLTKKLFLDDDQLEKIMKSIDLDHYHPIKSSIHAKILIAKDEEDVQATVAYFQDRLEGEIIKMDDFFNSI